MSTELNNLEYEEPAADEQNIFCENCRIIKTIYWRPQKAVKCVCELVEENGEAKNILDTEPESRINLVTDLNRWKTLIPKIQSFSNEQYNAILSSPNLENSMNLIAYIINSFAKFKEDFLSLLHYLDKKVYFQMKNLGKICEIKEFVDELKPDESGNYDFSHIESDPQLETLSVRLGLFLIDNDLNFGEGNFLEEISQELLSKLDGMTGKTSEFVTRVVQFFGFLGKNPIIPIEAYETQIDPICSAYEELREKLNDIFNEDKPISKKPSSNSNKSNNNNNKLDSRKSLGSNNNLAASGLNKENMDKIAQLNEQLAALMELKDKYEADLMKLMPENNQLKEEQKKSQIRMKAAQDELETIYFQVQKISEVCKLEPHASSVKSNTNSKMSRSIAKEAETSIKANNKKNVKTPFGGSEASKFKACLDTLSLIEAELMSKKSSGVANNLLNTLNNSSVVVDLGENTHNSSRMRANNYNNSNNDKENLIRLTQKTLIEEKMNQSFSGKFENEIKKYKDQVAVLQEIMYTAQQDNKNLQAELDSLIEAKGIIEIEAKHLKQICDYNETCQRNLLETLQRIQDERVEEYENYYGNEIPKPSLNIGESSVYDAVENYIKYVSELDKFYYRLHREFDCNKEELEELKIAYENHVETHKSFKNEVQLRIKIEDEKYAELNLNYIELEAKQENFMLKFEALEKELIKEKIKNAIFSENFDTDKNSIEESNNNADNSNNNKDKEPKESKKGSNSHLRSSLNVNTNKNTNDKADNKNPIDLNSKSTRNVIKKKFINEYERCLKQLEEKQLAYNKLLETHESEVKNLSEKITSLQSNFTKQQKEYEEFLEVKDKFFDEKQSVEENFIKQKNEISLLKKKESESKDYINYIQKLNNELKEKLRIQSPGETNLFLLMNTVISSTPAYQSETDYKTLHKMMQSLIEEKEKMVGEVFSFYEKYENLNTQKRSFEDLSEKQSEEIKELTKQIDSLTEKVKEFDKFRVKLDAMEKENSNMKSLLEKKKEELILEITDNENAKHNSIIGGIENEGDDFLLLKTSNLNLNYKLENLRDKITFHEIENNFLKTKLLEIENQLEKSLKRLKDSERLKIENLFLKSTNSNFSCEIKTLKNEISSLNSKISKYSLEIMKLKSEAQLNDKSLSNIHIPSNNIVNAINNELNNSKLLNISNDNFNFDYNMNYNIVKDLKIENTTLNEYKPNDTNVSVTYKTQSDVNSNPSNYVYCSGNIKNSYANANLNNANQDSSNKYNYVKRYTQDIAKLDYNNNNSNLHNKFNYSEYNTPMFSNDSDNASIATFTKKATNTSNFASNLNNNQASNYVYTNNVENTLTPVSNGNSSTVKYTTSYVNPTNNLISPLNTEASQSKIYQYTYENNINNNAQVNKISKEATSTLTRQYTNNNMNNSYTRQYTNNNMNNSYVVDSTNYNNDNLNKSYISATGNKSPLNASLNKSNYYSKEEVKTMNNNISTNKSFEKIIKDEISTKTYVDGSAANKAPVSYNYKKYESTSDNASKNVYKSGLDYDLDKVNQIVSASKQNFTSTNPSYDVSEKLNEIDRIYAESINKIKNLDNKSSTSIYTGKTWGNYKSVSELNQENNTVGKTVKFEDSNINNAANTSAKVYYSSTTSNALKSDVKNAASNYSNNTATYQTTDEVQNILNKYSAKNSLNVSYTGDSNKYVSAGNENVIKYEYKADSDNLLSSSYLNNRSYTFTDVNRSGNEMTRSDVSNYIDSSFSNVGGKGNFPNNLDTYSNFGDRSFDYKPGFYQK